MPAPWPDLANLDQAVTVAVTGAATAPDPTVLPSAVQTLATRLVVTGITNAMPAPDPLWVSVLRGRVLAALASGLTLWTAGSVLWREVHGLVADGVTPEHAAALVAQGGTFIDSGTALLLAGSGLVGLVASVVSKVRSRLRAARAAALVGSPPPPAAGPPA